MPLVISRAGCALNLPANGMSVAVYNKRKECTPQAGIHVTLNITMIYDRYNLSEL